MTVGSTQGSDIDGVDDIIVGPGPGGGPNLRVFSGATGSLITDMLTFDSGFTGGIYVGGGTPAPQFPVAPLRFGGGLIAGDASALTQSQLNVITAAALERLEAEGASTAVIEELSSVDVRVTDLADGLLGLWVGGTILIDVNASGAGWFISIPRQWTMRSSMRT